MGSAVLYTLLVIIDNRIPPSTVENTVVSEAQSKQRRLSVWDPYPFLTGPSVIPVVSGHSFETMLVAFLLLLAGVLFRGF